MDISPDQSRRPSTGDENRRPSDADLGDGRKRKQDNSEVVIRDRKKLSDFEDWEHNRVNDQNLMDNCYACTAAAMTRTSTIRLFTHLEQMHLGPESIRNIYDIFKRSGL